MMVDDHYYLRENVTDVDAAVVGVSRLRWRSLTPEEARPERAKEVMRHHQFDVLPIDPEAGEVREYFVTRAWGEYTAVERREIAYEDVLPHQSPLRDVLRGFAQQDRRFFFLTREHRVTGLITVANLNCRQARIYLFSLMSELETRMGEVIRSELDRGNLTEEDVLAEAKADVRERFEEDRKNDVEREVVEYLYLTDICKIIRKQALHGVLGFTAKGRFKSAFGSLPDLRNDVAHPPKPLVRTPDAASKLWEQVVTMERALFHLRQWAPSAETD